jgi:hypothetical protein
LIAGLPPAKPDCGRLPSPTLNFHTSSAVTQGGSLPDALPPQASF